MNNYDPITEYKTPGGKLIDNIKRIFYKEKQHEKLFVAPYKTDEQLEELQKSIWKLSEAISLGIITPNEAREKINIEKRCER